MAKNTKSKKVVSNGQPAAVKALPSAKAAKTSAPLAKAGHQKPVTAPTLPQELVEILNRPARLPHFVRLRHWLKTPRAARAFVIMALAVLLATTVFWAVLSAWLHEANADQLIDGYLFETPHTFREAVFPGTHTFLLKWPLFAVMQLAGGGLAVYLVATVLLVLVSVGLLVLLVWRIERRPWMFGLLCLALASMLLLVPAQPYPGALLPVNMAMTTTRNLEYAAFIAILYYAIRLRKLRSWRTLGLVAGLALVIASDKLFTVLAAGSALFIALWYAVVWHRHKQASAAFKWVAVTLVAVAVSTAGLRLLGWSGISHILNSDAASPFATSFSPRQLAVAAIYGVGALLTNFGANPVHGVLVLRDLPAALLASLRQPVILAYTLNGGLLLVAVVSAVKLLIQRAPFSKAAGKRPIDHWTHLAVMLLGASLAAIVVFVTTDHYYPVDARYLTIALFGLTIAAASYWRFRTLGRLPLTVIGGLLALSLPLGSYHAWQEYSVSQTAMAPRTAVTARVATELDRHAIKRLVGDYWDITPVKARTAKKLTTSAVDNCVTPRPVLNSAAWFQQSKRTPTAYLAVRDGSGEAGPEHLKAASPTMTTYGGCSLARVVGSYGVPSERIPIGDTINPNGLPNVLLLLYPDGIKPPKPATKPVAPPLSAAPLSIQPAPPPALVPLSDRAICSQGTTLQTVAHEDDDLLFMSPDLFGTIAADHCLRTVYLTAGNAGEKESYWGGREQGVMAAYAQMYGVKNDWHEERQTINGKVVSVEYLADVPEVSLVFLRLPDGNLRGEGYASNHYQSLSGLLAGRINQIEAVDGSASYSLAALTDCLTALMQADQADSIRTLASADAADGDHADHHAVGVLTDQASALYPTVHNIVHYLGYPEKSLPVNLSEADIERKQATFLTYAKFDGAVCQTAAECQQTITYGSYLTRQYLTTAIGQ